MTTAATAATPPSGRRPWTRAGALLTGAHVLYELGAGVGVPLASRIGIAPAAGVFTAGTVAAVREAGRRPPSADPAFCAVNGLYLAAVVGHFVSWPRGRRAGLPWLIECEGLRGTVLQPYNALLHLSWLAAVGGLIENRSGRRWGVVVPALVVPVLRRVTPNEYARLLLQARRRPRWWNRRLQPLAGAGASGHRGRDQPSESIVVSRAVRGQGSGASAARSPLLSRDRGARCTGLR